MDSQIRSWALAIVCVSLLVGCSEGGDHPATVPVSGTVTLDGQPLVGAQVAFTAKQGEASRKALGTTDAQGKYQLTTFEENDGAVVGPQVVTIVKAAAGGAAAAAGSEDESEDPSAAMADVMSGGDADKGEEEAIPDQEATVTADGPNVFDFAL